MKTIQNLPDLVIIGILRNAVKEVIRLDDIAPSLPYLAICRQWRHLALPMVHNSMLIRFDFVSNEDGEREHGVLSNIEILDNVKCNLLVKCLYINWARCPFMDNLDMLMNTIAMDKMAWPKDISRHLVGNIFENHFSYNPQKLDNKMYEKMSITIDNFRDTFPNVKEIKFKIYDSCGVASQFISKFVAVYFNQLTMLTNYGDIPLDLPCFPPNLECLWYKFQPMVFSPMPKINTLPLKVLNLSEIPKDFSWKQCCSSLIFPNLKVLAVSSLNDDFQSIREDYAHSHGIKLNMPDNQHERLEVPVVKYLRLLPHYDPKTWIILKNVPRNLHELTYNGDLEGLEYFSNLPIDSLGILDITLQDFVDSLDKFYRVTNRLFGKDIENNSSTAIQYFIGGPAIDFQRTRWENVTDMHFQYLNNIDLVTAIAAIPELIRLKIDFWGYIDEEVDWGPVANSKIEKISLGDLEYDGLLRNPANYIVQLYKSLKSLREASIPEELLEILLPKLEQAKKEYQHLQELEVE